MNESAGRLAGSFRDPSGYVFDKDGQLYRRITDVGRDDFDFFIASGLAAELISKGQLVPFTVEDEERLTLKLHKLPFISYPYEWSFSQLKQGALLTIDIMLASLKKNMILKDASAFNISFYCGKAIFLDHTSFTRYAEGCPWCAYRQFIMHFLNPLVLMQKKDLRLLELLKNDVNGIPLDLAAKLLPTRSMLDVNLLFHIHLHSFFEKKYSAESGEGKVPYMSKKHLENLLLGMRGYLSKLKYPDRKTQWGDYTGLCSYTAESFEEKKAIVESFCRCGNFDRICDLGASQGEFSVIAAAHAREVIAADMDPGAVERLFQKTKKFPNIYPLLLDLNNPTPGLGVFNEERESALKRCKGDAVLGLALIHHLRISGNWTLEQIVRLFRRAAPRALVEFIPLDDPQAAQLLRGRKLLCPEWELGNVVKAFSGSFKKCRICHIAGSPRVLINLDDR